MEHDSSSCSCLEEPLAKVETFVHVGRGLNEDHPGCQVDLRHFRRVRSPPNCIATYASGFFFL